MASKLNTKMILKLTGALIALAFIGLAFTIWNTMREPTWGGDFNLVHRDQRWTFAQHAKGLNLLYIGYVKCPDVCPLSLSHSAEAFRELTVEEKERVRLTFVSVDASHDTATSVADYASQFFPSFVGLTGSENEIRKVVILFGASFVVDTDSKSYLGYSISHTDRLFFLNKKGIVIDSIPNPRSSADILNKIRSHL
ncbi:MAG: SCO family protein [Proteobacteria bacterium]|nr:MAG: SCO family protein [Pseudomonadota bacterium]